jgi:hypothetical protein
VAGLFAVHPLHVESVAWVAERKDVLSGFFYILALAGYAFYARMPGRRRYGVVLVLFVLGLMSKPMVVTLPFALLLLDVRVANAVLSYVSYLKDMVWPTRLAAYYPYPTWLPGWPLALPALVAIAAASVLAIVYGRRRPYLQVGWFW